MAVEKRGSEGAGYEGVGDCRYGYVLPGERPGDRLPRRVESVLRVDAGEYLSVKPGVVGVKTEVLDDLLLSFFFFFCFFPFGFFSPHGPVAAQSSHRYVPL